jgi:hypothetical protein
VPATAPSTNLFGNPQPSNSLNQPPKTTLGAATTNPLATGNLFAQNANKSSNGGSLTSPTVASNNVNTNTNPAVGSPPNAGTFAPTNPVLSSPQNTL